MVHTFGGIPLITGMRRMYRNSKTVVRPAASEVANNGLESPAYPISILTSHRLRKQPTHLAAPLSQTSLIFSNVPSTYVAAPPGTTNLNCLTRCAESILSR